MKADVYLAAIIILSVLLAIFATIGVFTEIYATIAMLIMMCCYLLERELNED